MNDRHQCLRLSLILGLMLLFPISCGSGSSQPEKVTSLSSEVTQLLWQYEHMRELGQAGRADSFMAMRESVSVALVKDYYGRVKVPIDSAVVWRWAGEWPDVAGLPLIQDTSDGQWRRLTFVTTGVRNKKGQQMMLYPIILFRKEGSVWKVSNASRLLAPKLDKNGKEVLFSSLTYNPMFCIPPVIPNLDSLPSGPPSGPPPKPDKGIPVDLSKIRRK